MTVSSTSSKSPLYTGNGTTGPWAFAFKTFATSELEVVQADAAGTETVLALTTDYTVSLNADQNNDPGGEVTTVVAVPNDGSTIIIRWGGEPTQGLGLETAGGFYPEAQENAFDKLSMLVQKLAEELDRSLRVSITAGETVGTEIGGSAAARADRYLGFDASGNLTLSSSFSAGALTVSAFMETVLDDTTAGAARTTLGAAAIGANTFTGLQTWAAGADIASAATLDLTAATGNIVRITGTTATSSVTLNNGQMVVCVAVGAWPLTHHATNHPLPGSASYTCAAGDLVIYWQDGSGVKHVQIRKVDGTALVSTSGMPRSYLAGCGLSNNGTDATNDIDIAVGSARDSTNAEDMVLASALTKRLDAAWAVGTNQGGLDTGSIANGTYHVWLIKRSDTDVVDVLFSTSASAPTMPTNYDYKRRIGAILRESATIIPFTQTGDHFARSNSVLDISANNPGTSAVTRTLSVPTGVRVDALIGVEIQETAAIGPAAVYISDLSTTDEAPAVSGHSDVTPAANVASRSQNGAGRQNVMTNTSAQVRSRVSNSAASTTLYIRTFGWVDTRGRE